MTGELPPVSAPRILIVDDDLDHSSLLADALTMYYESRADSHIVRVATGAEALAQPLTEFDMLLVDYHLPDMEGMELLEKILRQAELPVIFVTGENDLTIAAKAIEDGAQDYVVKSGDYLFAIPAIVQKNLLLHKIKVDNQRLSARLQTMLEELRIKNEQLEDSMKKLREMATTDSLTGLYNRRYFGEQLNRLYEEAVRYDNDLSCCMIDMDHFKQLNDTLGHQMGDQLICMLSNVIRSNLRSSDMAARYGGDEFVLLLPQTSSLEGNILLERIREQIARQADENSKIRFPVTLSIGIASLREDYPESPDGLVSMADRALYHAKELGRNCVCDFSQLRREIQSKLDTIRAKPGH
jgi:two-component system cell cycle response regulator